MIDYSLTGTMIFCSLVITIVLSVNYKKIQETIEEMSNFVWNSKVLLKRARLVVSLLPVLLS